MITDVARQRASTPEDPPPSHRKHHWWQWVVAGLGAILVLAVAAAFMFTHFFAGTAPAPLTLPKPSAAAGATSGVSIDGTWTIGQGSLAGYRVHEDFLGQGNSIVGRTSAVTGNVVIVQGDVTSAAFRIDLLAVKANGKTQPQLAGIIDTAEYPDATFTLKKPIVPNSELTMNTPITATATGLLTMHGTTRLITFQTTARQTGSSLTAAGSIPITFANWNIHAPYLVQEHGVLEFLLMLHR